MSTSPYYKGLPIKFSRGVYTAKDPVEIPDLSMSFASNIVLDIEGQPTKIEGTQSYNPTAMGTSAPIKGMVTFTGEDNNQYIVTACNNLLYWSSGSGIMTPIKYLNANVNITIDTANFFYRFVVYDKVISSTQKKVAYCISDAYPISTNSNGSGTNTRSSVSRALRLQVNNGVIIGLNVYYDAGGLTAGSDDAMVGQASTAVWNVGWPLQGKYAEKIYDRIVIANYANAPNGWIASNAQDSEGSVSGGGWTDNALSNLADTGGGKYPEPFTGVKVLNSSILMFSRHSVLNVQAVPGPITSWRETFIPTTLGALNQESIVLHTDGWVYFVSEEGIARTNGSVAERVDWNIQDQISNLTQLQQNAFNLALNEQTDWAGGAIIGTNILDTSSNILQSSLKNTKTQFDSGTYSTTDIVTVDGSISLLKHNTYVDGTITNPDFETGDFTGWTATTTGQSSPFPFGIVTNIYSTIFPQHGSYFAGFVAGTGGTQSYVVNILDTSGGTIEQHALSLTSYPSTSWQTITFTPAVSLGQQIRIQLVHVTGGTVDYNPTQKLTSNLFNYCGGSISIPYIYAKVSGGTATAIGVDNVSQNPATAGNIWNNSPADYVSMVYDYGEQPTTFGDVAVTATIDSPAGSIQWFAETSVDGYSWTTHTSLGTQTSPTFTASLPSPSAGERYLRLRGTITAGTATGVSTSSPAINSFIVGAEWVSAVKDLGSAPTGWGVLAVNTNIGLSSNVTLYMRSSTVNTMSGATWQVITNNTVPYSVSLNEFIQYRITFNTTDCTQVPQVLSIVQNYFRGSLSSALPSASSFKDRLYFSFMSNTATTNDHTWIGMTKPDGSVTLDPSGYTGIMYPAWTRCSFIGANVWVSYVSQLMYGDSTNGKIYINRIGLTKDGTAYTSYIVSRAIGTTDHETIFRFCYAYTKSSNPINLYYRTKRDAHGWSTWSPTLSVGASLDVAKSPKITFPGLNTADFIQFKLEETSPDTLFSIASLDLYAAAKNRR